MVNSTQARSVTPSRRMRDEREDFFSPSLSPINDFFVHVIKLSGISLWSSPPRNYKRPSKSGQGAIPKIGTFNFDSYNKVAIGVITAKWTCNKFLSCFLPFNLLRAVLAGLKMYICGALHIATNPMIIISLICLPTQKDHIQLCFDRWAKRVNKRWKGRVN